MGAAASDRHAAGGRGHPGLTIYLFIDSQRLLPDSGYRRDSGRLRSVRDHFVRGDGRPAAGAGARSSCKDPAVESLSSFIGVDGTNTTLNSGRIQINLKPLEERKTSASDVIRRLQPELAKVDGHHAVHAAGAGPDRGRPRQPHAISVHAGRSEADELNTFAPQMLEKLQQAAGAARRGQRPADSAACAHEAGLRPRHRVAPGHHAGDDRPHALRRLRAAPGLDDVHAAESVSRGAGSEARTSSADPSGPARSLYPLGRTEDPRELRSAWSRADLPRPSSFGPSSAIRGQRQVPQPAPGRLTSRPAQPAAFHAPAFPNGEPGAAERLHASGDRPPCRSPSIIRDSFRWSRSRSTWRRVRRWATRSTAINKVKDEIRHAGQHAGGLSGHGRSLPGFAGQRAAADSGGAGHGLHRAGRAVRELHPSDHDSLHAAFGGRGRAAGALRSAATTSASSR